MARTGRPKTAVRLTDEERETLETLVRRGTSEHRLVRRALIVLRTASGLSDKAVGKALGLSVHTVAKWRTRFAENRMEGLADEARPGAPRKVSDERVAEVVRKTLETIPEEATHWSRSLMAEKVGLTESTIGRIWRAFGLKPHRRETFILSNDPLFIEKVRDVVGLYLSPPQNAMLLCVDEKSQIQALDRDRTQPLLPLRPDQVELGTHDYERHGTTSLFAALDVATGNVIGKCYPRHTAKDFRAFLKEVDARIDSKLDVHLIMDNYATHKAPTVKRWLAANPRFHVHFIPTHSSWLNLVERWFGLLTERQIKRGAHKSVKSLIASIESFIKINNAKPKAPKWTKSAEEILASIARFCARTLEAHRP
jgi:transposase